MTRKSRSGERVIGAIRTRRRDSLRATGRESKPRRKWSKQAVLEAIRDRQRRGLPLTNVRQDDSGLGYAARKYFGNWRAALLAAGLKAKRQWSREQVIEAIETRRERGLSL